FVGSEVLRSATRCLDLLGRFDLWRNCRDDGSSHFLLDREDVLQHAVIALRPDVVAAQRVDELTGYPNSTRRLADAAFQHVADAKLLAHLLNVRGFAFVGER